MNENILAGEYASATVGAGSKPLEAWTTIRVSGADRASFLHNMCTNDIKGLAAGSGCEAFLTDVKGKIVAHTFVQVSADAIDLLTVPGQAERLIAHLSRYIIREDVELTDVSAETSWLLATGFELGGILTKLAPTSAELSAPWSHVRVELISATVDIVRCDLPWCGGLFLRANCEHSGVLRDALKAAGVADIGEEVWHAIRVESAWPLWGVDFDDSNLPQEVGRDNLAISFRKGCYLGQETVARIDALGHVNKKLVQVRFGDGPVPPAGSALSAAGQPVGSVTSASWSPRAGAPLAFAMLKRGHNAIGSTVNYGDLVGEVVEPRERDA